MGYQVATMSKKGGVRIGDGNGTELVVPWTVVLWAIGTIFAAGGAAVQSYVNGRQIETISADLKTHLQAPAHAGTDRTLQQHDRRIENLERRNP